MAVVVTLVQTKQIRIIIHNRNNKKAQYEQYKICASTHITKTPTQLPKHPHIHSPAHYKTSSNNHSTRYTPPNEIVTTQLSTLSIRSPSCTWYYPTTLSHSPCYKKGVGGIYNVVGRRLLFTISMYCVISHRAATVSTWQSSLCRRHVFASALETFKRLCNKFPWYIHSVSSLVTKLYVT